MRQQTSNGIATTFAVSLLLLAPASVTAQGGGVMVGARKSLTPPMNSCVRLKSMPTPLVDSPEGLEIFKMQRELGDVRDRLIRMQADTSNPALKQVLIVRSGVDSMVRFYSRSVEGPPGTIAFQFRTNGTPEGPSSAPSQAERMVVESMIREMQPKFDEAVRASLVTATINVRSNSPGYLGLMTSTSTFPSVLDNTRSFGYCDYPRVETVDAGSPAEKVGLSAGDTLLAYNNLDLLQHDVNYQSLLVPGKPLRIRYRREGQVREVSPTIVPRIEPERVFIAARTSCADPSMRAECERPQVVTGRPFGSFPMQVGTSMPARAMQRTAPILFPGSGAGRASLGGADLKVVSEEFQKSMGVAPGLLVLDVRADSPAYVAGIRDGDIIVAANEKPVRDVMSLNSALLPKIRERIAVLQVSSKAGLRTVTMKW